MSELQKKIYDYFEREAKKPQRTTRYEPYVEPQQAAFAADPIIVRMSREQLQKSIDATTQLMKEAAKNLDFIQAAQYRDEIVRLQQQLEEKK